MRNGDLKKLADSGIARVQPKESHIIRLRDGDLVCFKNDASQLAISSIWRKSAGTVWDWFAKINPNVLPMNPVRTQVTLAEQLFGFVEQAEETQKGPRIKALGGRLRFSTGRLCSGLAQQRGLRSRRDHAHSGGTEAPQPAALFSRRWAGRHKK